MKYIEIIQNREFQLTASLNKTLLFRHMIRRLVTCQAGKNTEHEIHRNNTKPRIPSVIYSLLTCYIDHCFLTSVPQDVVRGSARSRRINKMFEIRWEIPNSQRNVAGIFLPRDWQYCCNLRALPTTSLLCLNP